MLQKKYISFFLLLLMAATASAQKAERDFIRKGNRFFKDSVYVDAEVNYRKALETNPQSTVSMFNLGNTLAQQNKLQEAMEQYVAATKIEKDKNDLAQIYHNMGVIFQSQKDYGKAVEAYKQSLRNNPKDDETRYNLALAQKMLKDQQQESSKTRTRINSSNRTSRRIKRTKIKINSRIKTNNNRRNHRKRTVRCLKRMPSSF